MDAVYAEEPHEAADTDVRPTVAPSQPTPTVLAWLLSLLTPNGPVGTSPVRVLEVGAGHGYVTALLCHRFGAEQVTATDPAGADHTRARLAALDLFPCLVTAHGVRGASAYGPFDAILCATGRPAAMSPEWLGQLADGGRIVAAVRGPDGCVAAGLYERAEHGATVRRSMVTRNTAAPGPVRRERRPR